MTAAFGLSFEGKETPEQVRQLVATAEANGVETLWFACHLFQREPIAIASMALAESRRVKIALMAMSPFSIHPVYSAMAAATLDELYPGRVMLCFGVGAPRDLQSAGIQAPQPLLALREALTIAAELLAGEVIQFDGKKFQVHDRRLITGARKVPLVLAASGPQMLELAGRIADGVLISAATSVEFVQWCLEQVARGEQAAGKRIRRIGLVYAALGATEGKAHDKLRRTLAFILRGSHHARNLELAGSRLDQEALANAFIAENWPEVERLVTDDVVSRHAASGTAEQVRARFAAYNAIGLNELVLAGQSDASILATVLQAAAARAG